MAREVEPSIRMHIDHAYITGVGLLLILVDSFSGWPEVTRVPNKNISTIKTDFKDHILQKRHTKNHGIQQCSRIL